MSTELFTVATRPTPGLSRLQASLSKFGVSISILGQNEAGFWGFGWKWKTFVRAARVSSADRVLFCDAYDSICLDSVVNMESKFDSLGVPILFSYEPQTHPEYWTGLSSGLVIANRQALMAAFPEEMLEEFLPHHFNDQERIQMLYAWDAKAFELDREGILFHTVGARSPALVVKDGQLINPETGKAPSFVHAPYNWDLSAVEALIATLDG